MTVSTIDTNSTGWISSCRLRVSMRETSSRSSTRCACCLAQREIVSSARLEAAASSAPAASILNHPMIAPSGVRSSCETIARNSSFARLAASASARAFCSQRRSRSRSAAAFFFSEMSRTTITPPRTRPQSFLIGAAHWSIGMIDPLLLCERVISVPRHVVSPLRRTSRIGFAANSPVASVRS